MTYFLERIASLLNDEYGDRLEKQCLVFPNRRAGLYFLKYLAARIDKPVWTPTIITINELFSNYTQLQKADNEILLFELYRVYRKLKKDHENFDDFYFWGDMLVNDFDDIDKYMIDVPVLFRTVRNIKDIENEFGGLTSEQIEIIKRFWVNFNQDKLTPEKEGFLSVWKILSELYTEFRNALRIKNIAYEGMIFRDVAEQSMFKESMEIKWDNIHFIGFNALNNCEKAIMSFCKNEVKAKFYWDYDNMYLTGNKLNSAGFFLRQNIKTFGNDMPSDWSYDTLLSAKKGNVTRKVIDTSSDVAQVKLISQLIGVIPGISTENAHHTAIVLADENLLVPALTSLPQNVGEVNITMGYPLKQSQVYTFIKHILILQKNSKTENSSVYFNYQDVLNILKNRFITGLLKETSKGLIEKIVSGNLLWVPKEHFENEEFLKIVFQKMDSPALLSAYLRGILSEISSNSEKINEISSDSQIQKSIRNEFIYRILLSVNRLETIVNSPDIAFTTDTYIRILDRILRGQSVPFSGEPLSGIQIMGILETRALDFTNIVMVSVNEGVLPGGSVGSSFIPFSLREAFGLPTINHQESIYAYHFYRLLQRAANVTFIYNSNSEGLKTGEMSRFLQQMKYEPEMSLDFLNLRFDIRTHNSLNSVLERTETHNSQLLSLFSVEGNGAALSPTAINTWLNCSMRFYYRYVNRLKEMDEISVEIDPAMFGTMLHDIMKILYSDLIGKLATEKDFGLLIKDDVKISGIIDGVITNTFFKGEKNELRGSELIVKEILKTYVLQIIRRDRSVSPLTILSLEESFEFTLNTPTGLNKHKIRTGGVVDRVDKISGLTRIVDYKTGSVAGKIDSVQALFSDKRKKDYDGWLQTLLYCEAYLVSNPGAVLCPTIYKIKEFSDERSSDKLTLKGSKGSDLVVEDYRTIREEFVAELYKNIENIFSIDEPFVMTDDNKKCEYCPYRTLCMR